METGLFRDYLRPEAAEVGRLQTTPGGMRGGFGRSRNPNAIGRLHTRRVEPEYCEDGELIVFEAFGLGDMFDVSVPEE